MLFHICPLLSASPIRYQSCVSVHICPLLSGSLIRYQSCVLLYICPLLSASLIRYQGCVLFHCCSMASCTLFGLTSQPRKTCVFFWVHSEETTKSPVFHDLVSHAVPTVQQSNSGIKWLQHPPPASPKSLMQFKWRDRVELT